MATLTKSTGTVTLSGAVEKVAFPAVYGWVWVKNMSDADMFVGLSESVSAGADGVLAIPAGECGRVQTDGQDSVYLMGSGNALVVAQNYADCPFKVGGKGGEIPDLSEYAKTADVPNIKVNEAVNADTVGGISPDKISTTPIKSTTGTYAIDEWGGATLWFVGSVGTPIFAYSKEYYAAIVPMLGGNELNVWRLSFAADPSVFGTSREITIVYY